jgi:hypothetical protein
MEKPKKQNRSLLKTVLVIVLIMGSLEITLDFLQFNNTLGEPYQWGDRSDIPFKINEARSLFSGYSSRTVKILIYGDSRAEYDVDPRVIDTFFHNSTISYNLGLSATSNKFQTFLLKNTVLSRDKPDLLIWIVSQNDFDTDNFTISQDAHNFGEPMGRYYSGNVSGLDWQGLCDFALLKISSIYRYRDVFFPRAIFGSAYTYDWSTNLDRGYARTYEQNYSSNASSIVNSTFGVGFDTESAQDFLDTLDFLENMKIPYLIVLPPWNYVHQVNLPLDVLCSQIQGNSLLDLNGNLSIAPDAYYFNTAHLNSYGAKVCTTFICAKIKNIVDGLIDITGS